MKNNIEDINGWLYHRIRIRNFQRSIPDSSKDIIRVF
ncbi:hypothetical protein MUB48_12365 [Blautia sp. NSJ-157]|nr:hypothetical protein [Blautia sp. NSJ-157]MCJ7865522.1 hypothetical protein [Blautia sp. NSJ-140]